MANKRFVIQSNNGMIYRSNPTRFESIQSVQVMEKLISNTISDEEVFDAYLKKSLKNKEN